MLEDARADVAATGRSAAGAIGEAADRAPDEPGFFSKALDQVGEFLGGAWDATTGMVEFFYKLSPVYLLIDPEGFVEKGVSMLVPPAA